MKWGFLPKDDSKPHYLVVNGDESEPGACKDVPLMMATPHTLIEGAAIASYAIGASHAFIYVRGEVLHVIRRLRHAVQEAYAAGYLGRNILGSGFDLDVIIHAGAGAYICGEETALGNSSRLSVAMGLRKRDDRPLGVAVRTYYKTPRHDDDYLESWLDLWDGDRLLPGYGWIFGMGDGTSNVGLGLLNTSAAFGNTDYHALLRQWLKGMPAEWGFTEENRTQPIRGAALPMGFNRTPHYYQGLLLVGDAGGMVNPFNGEGIAYAMESGEILARTITQALARARRAETERVLAGYPHALSQAYGGYYALGRVFVKAIGRPGLMRFATRHSMSRPALMGFALKLLANLTDTRGDAADRLVNGLSKLAPNPE